jgi:uncharacterized protein YgiM (DUF1202 family)
VRSGPSHDFYETDRLSAGFEVEVYRHDANGWCAVRPPKGSFSWVPAQQLQRTDNPSVAQVIKTPLKTRVGSRFNDIHDVEYISLRQGELVKLLGSKTISGDEGKSEEWLRISPPAGEFRWIHISDLHAAQDGQVEIGHDATEHVESTDEGSKAKEDAIADNSFGNSPNGEIVGSGRITTHPLAERTTVMNEKAEVQAATAFSEIKATPTTVATLSTDLQTPAPPDQQDVSAEWRAVTQSKDVLLAPEPRSFQDRLAALNLLLSQTVLADVEEWKLGALVEHIRRLAEQGSTADERLEATMLLEKTLEFQDLQTRKRKLAASDSPLSHVEPEPLPNFAPDATLSAVPEMPRLPRSKAIEAGVTSDLRLGEVPDNSMFDASGFLVSVVSRRSDMPRYALTDENGQILRFVAPSHDLNLSSHLNKRVGVTYPTTSVGRGFRTD